MNRSEILTTAESLVSGDRQKQHGSASQTYETVARLWSVYYDCAYGARDTPRYQEFKLSAKDAILMMALMKIGRAIHTKNPDNYVDACGYISLAGEEDTNET